VSPKSLPSYAAVTPVRDEAGHFPRTANAMLAQTHRPRQWVIVDDGSEDATGELADDYAGDHDWITVVHRPRAAPRARGGNVIRAFEAGREALAVQPEFVVKLDGDLFFPPYYFAWVAATFAREPRAGLVGGRVLIWDGTEWRPEPGGRHHVHGSIKAYRARCLQDIGGLQPAMGWDGLDEYAARARGWEVHMLSELAVLHFELRGSKQRWWRARWEEGRGSHWMGYRWEWLALRVGYRMLVERPPLLGGLVLGLGFAYARARGLPQAPDALALAQVRADQAARLRGLARGRRVALPELPDGGPAFWTTGDPG
jgi:poly-beta-1,6-N-acetyl-D-glucosamine synthase